MDEPGAMIILFGMARNVFFDSEDEESNLMPKGENYAEEIVPRFSDKQFQMHFRLIPGTFEDVLEKVGSVINDEILAAEIAGRVHSNNIPMPLDKQLMITIWCLANLESLRSVADRFGISKSTCWDVLYRICRNLLKVNSKYKMISWPSRERARTIMTYFQQINGFPRIVGSIDGCHIRIIKPKEHPNSYCNRKNFHSVLLQGVCDHRKLFLDVYSGEPGSIHDMRLFRKSDLYRNIQNGTVEFPDDSHLIGDLAYKLSVNLLVGFKNVGVLTNRQKNYNKKLSQCRVIIENAFAYLKGRFRRLKFMETVRLDLTVLLVVSACILHNNCILNGDLPEEIVDERELVQIINEQIGDDEYVNDRDENDGIIKRLDIMNGLQMANNLQSSQ